MIHRLLKRRTDDSRSESIWLTVYSDLMTNLLLVFMALYGLVTMGNEALQQALGSMRDTPMTMEQPDQGQKISLEQVAYILRQEFKENPDISVVEEGNATRILFGESTLFESGRADLKLTARPILAMVSNLLTLVPYTVVVEGHTDDRPLKNTRLFRDNWELSLARAMAVVNVLIKEENMKENQIAAAAYGDNRPRSSNLTAASRSANRRVEIAIYKDVPYEL